MTIQHNYSHIQATKKLVETIGLDQIKELHTENRFLDILAIIVIWTTLLAMVYLLGTLEFGLTWVICFIFQGFVMQWLVFCSHDLFTHRKVGGAGFSRLMAIIFHTPILLSGTAVMKTHMDHHKMFGVKGDSEEYKIDLDRRWVKILFLTLPGIILVTNRKFMKSKGESEGYMGSKRHKDEKLKSKILDEQKIVIVFLFSIVALFFFFPNYLVYGYILPLLFSLPFASTLRTLLEHANIDKENPYQNSTYYKTGFVTKFLFFWGTGDCHIVHHFFPSIPFYQMNKALKLIRPIIDASGAHQTKSITWILKKWFIENKPHGTRWELPS